MSHLVPTEGIDDPSDFQASVFQDLDEHFRCPICKEFFETTMILSTCSHSFCALCIRRSLNTEQNCPQCRKPAYESSLIHNYALDHVVNTWRNSRSFILSVDRLKSTPSIPQHDSPVISSTSSHFTNNTPIDLDHDPSDDFVPPTLKRTMSSNSAGIRRSNRLTSKVDKGKGAESSPLDLSYVVDHQSSPNIPAIMEPSIQSSVPQQQKTSQNVEEPLKSSTMVECPICTQIMAMVVINQHIDSCMRGDSRIPPTPSTQASSSGSSRPESALSNIMQKKPVDLGRKPSKVVYNLLNDKDLKKVLRELGLSDQGDRNTKIWRHKEYINLYNANYDSDSPVSAYVLIQRLNMTEQQKLNDQFNQMKRKATDVDQHKMMYSSQFQELIENAKRNRIEKKKDSSTPQENNGLS